LDEKRNYKFKITEENFKLEKNDFKILNGLKCDVFSFGIIMFQLLAQCDDNEIYPKTDGNIDFSIGSDPNFRPIISENYLKDEKFNDYLSKNFFIFLFFLFFFILFLIIIDN